MTKMKKPQYPTPNHIKNKSNDLSFLHIISLLLLTLFTNIALGQTQIKVKLTIDTNCVCNDSLTSKFNGKFGIYSYAPLTNSSNYTDNLIKELKLEKEQTITLEPGTYKFIYSPSDSSERKNQYYFALNQYETQIHLNCFFFNKSYHSLLDIMGKKDSFVISSTYFGITNGGTIVPTHTVVIFRKRKKYYASYYKTEQKGLSIPAISTKSPKHKPQILLTEEQVHRFRQFEVNFLKLSINDNLSYEVNTKNNIWINGEKISFDSKGYIALLLWNELNKTTAKPQTQP